MQCFQKKDRAESILDSFSSIIVSLLEALRPSVGASGFVGLFKMTSNLYVACGLIFKGLICYFSMITQYPILRRKPLKIRPLLNQGVI